MSELLLILTATICVSLVSFSGAVLFVFNHKRVQKYMILFVALAAGTLLGTAFFHLIPESFNEYSEGLELSGTEIHNHSNEAALSSYFILFGIIFFYIIEKFIRWHHHHDLNCKHHSLSTLSLVGDGFHNIIDGALIAVAFMTDVTLGFVTTIAIMLHEIPQEIGDLSILLHSGFSKLKALFFNFLSAITAIIGAIFAYFTLGGFNDFLPLLTAFVAGAFIYIALADIIPELHENKNNLNRFLISGVFLFGIVLSFSLTFIGH